jgi:hypothetical protein
MSIAQPDPKEQPELYPVSDRLHVLPGLAHRPGERRRACVLMALVSLGIVALVAFFVLLFR